jgi:hypothetical protein
MNNTYFEHKNNISAAFQQYCCNISAIIMYAINIRRRKDDEMRESPLHAHASPRWRRAGLL